MKLFILGGIYQIMFKVKLKMSDRISLFLFFPSSHRTYRILIFHLDIYRELIHEKKPMQKEVLLLPKIDKYNNKGLRLGNTRDYLRLGGKYRLKVFKSEPSKVYEKISRKSEISAQTFDPFVLRKANIERLCSLSDKSVHVGYDKYFSPNTISSLKKELPKAKADSCREYGFSSIPNSKLYETSLELKKKTIELPENYIDDRKKDPDERDCRIWKFWKDKLLIILNSYFIKMLFGLLSSHNYQVVLLNDYSLR